MTRLTLLGTGDSAGFPLYGCECALCQASREGRTIDGLPTMATTRRRPCSALLQVGQHQLLIDAGLMDIGERFPAGTLSALLLTHFHADHVQGLFHLRWGRGESLPVYCPPDPDGCADLYKHPGILAFSPIEVDQPIPQLSQLDPTLRVFPLALAHSKLTYGYLFFIGHHTLAYLTDTKGLPSETYHQMQRLLGDEPLDHLVIDASFSDRALRQASKNHNTLSEAIAIHHQLSARQTTLTHIGHDLHVELMNPPNLPPDIHIGYDEMVIRA